MPLTPEQITAARQKLGIQAPPDPVIANRTSVLDTAWGPPKTGINSDFKETVNTAAKGVGDIFNERGKKAVDIYKEGVNNGSPTVHGQAEAALRQVGNVAGAVGDFFAKPIAAGSEVASNTKGLQDFASHPVVGALLDTVNKGVMPVEHAWQTLETHHPELAKDIGAVGNIAGLFLGAGGTKGAATVAGKGLEAAGAARQGIGEAVGETVSRGTSNFKDSITQKAVDSLESKYTELLTGTKGRNKAFDRSQVAAAAKNSAGTEGLPPQRVLAEAGVVPKQEGSRLRTAQQADEFRRTVEPLQKANREALTQVERSTKPVSLDAWEEDAVRRAETPENINAGTADGLVKEIRNEFAALKSRYGETVPITTVDDIKSARWKPVKFDSTRPLQSDANYLIAKSGQQTIEQVAKDAGFNDVAQLNRHIGDRLEAAKFLGSLDGQILKGGRLTGLLYQAIGSTFGHTIPGKIIGAVGGNAVANMLISNSVSGPVKRLILRNLEKTDPEAYKAALQWLEDEKALQGTRPQLPPGDTTQSRINQGNPIPAGPAAPKEFTGPETRVGNYKPPMRGFIKIGETTSDPLKIAEEHITSTKQILENLPKEEIDSLGGMAALLSRAKTNIVDGLRAEGLTKESNAIKAIDETTFKDVESFDKAVQEAIPKGKGGAPNDAAFKNFNDLSTKLLGKLEGRTTVSKQFIEDLTNSADLKQPERDLFRRLLADEGPKVNVTTFANKVKSELLPLETKSQSGTGRQVGYENITLPEEIRGPVANYSERIYQSPISTSAGDVHFPGETKNYFAHSRIEDLPGNKASFGDGDKLDDVLTIKKKGENPVAYQQGDTRRVIELQSDLFQKGRLEGEAKTGAPVDVGADEEFRRLSNREMMIEGAENRSAHLDELAQIQKDKQKLIDEYGPRIAEFNKTRGAELAKLEPFRNTWHERLIREEVKQAAIDGKTKLQFPTGETAMKVEGLGNNTQFSLLENGRGDRIVPLTPDKLSVGAEVKHLGSKWIITDVLGDGKFKAAQKDSFMQDGGHYDPTPEEAQAIPDHFKETFDISGSVDKSNPIYKFYEKEVGRYLKNKYGAERITDPQGVDWYQVNVSPEQKKLPIEAFGAVAGLGIGATANQQ